MTSKTSNQILTLGTDDFQRKVLESDIPVLVDFWADWCQPCHMLAPVVDQLAETYAGRITVGKVDIDANGDLATRYDINSIPTILVFRGGEVVERLVGVRAKADYTAALDALLE